MHRLLYTTARYTPTPAQLQPRCPPVHRRCCPPPSGRDHWSGQPGGRHAAPCPGRHAGPLPPPSARLAAAARAAAAAAAGNNKWVWVVSKKGCMLGLLCWGSICWYVTAAARADGHTAGQPPLFQLLWGCCTTLVCPQRNCPGGCSWWLVGRAVHPWYTCCCRCWWSSDSCTLLAAHPCGDKHPAWLWGACR
jgi:hypothetical protein